MIDGSPVHTCYWCILQKTTNNNKIQKQYVMVLCIMKIYRYLYIHSNQVNVSLQFINDTNSSNLLNLSLYFIYVLLVKIRKLVLTISFPGNLKSNSFFAQKHAFHYNKSKETLYRLRFYSEIKRKIS